MVLGLQWLVDKITFPSPPSSYSLTSHPELFFVKTPSSDLLHPGVPCMLYAIPQGAPVLLVHAHSNGCDIGDMQQTLASIAEALRVHVLSFEFPGYGLHLGTSNMASINEAASAVLDFIVKELRVDPCQIVWYGRSIGSGPAISIAHRITKEYGVRPGGLVVQCGYANFPEVAGHLFGRIAKRLVTKLWPNEAMMKELDCPVLLMHGRNDTMIPLAQSYKLWNAVKLRELSQIAVCDCGHNNFDFRRCTLKPIYDFLLSVVSSATYPTVNFTVEVPAANRTHVHHIGPLRQRIPVYGFRRPELEEWIHRLQSPDAACATNSNGSRAALTDSSPATGQGDPSGGNAGVATNGNQAATKNVGGAAAAEGNKDELSNSGSNGTQGKQKDALSPPPPTMPDLCHEAASEDVSSVLEDPLGLVRTCAHRVSRFLEHLQRQLERVENLELRTVEEIVSLVEGEFWQCDPLMCLWEEVSYPKADVVRFRLGPFCVDNFGRRTYDPGFALSQCSTSGQAGDEKTGFLRIPVWSFLPSAAHFRCLAEWSLLQSDRLRKSLQVALRQPPASCAPCKRSSRRSSDDPAMKDAEAMARHPTRGVLATSVACHFGHWAMQKNEDVKAIFQRFAALYRNPRVAFDQLTDEELTGCESFTTAEQLKAKATPERPWPASEFSSAARAYVMQGAAPRSARLQEYFDRVWGPPEAAAVLSPRNPPDLRMAKELLMGHAAKNADWAAAGLFQHVAQTCCEKEEGSADPLGSDLRDLSETLCKAMKVFAQADQVRRREQERRKLLAMMQVSEPPQLVAGPLPGDEPASLLPAASLVAPPEAVGDTAAGSLNGGQVPGSANADAPASPSRGSGASDSLTALVPAGVQA
eukprot:TRINITY_DN17054_c0_g1_i1.p1 TRINITY_DN17054_c0_g1~~TRINITY_DN17054_c0_g1_i1.p1  ORF type:complete len:867 (+),score=180.32 TRINITY_DN17054_c0_g1_i1:174-2774(+)